MICPMLAFPKQARQANTTENEAATIINRSRHHASAAIAAAIED